MGTVGLMWHLPTWAAPSLRQALLVSAATGRPLRETQPRALVTRLGEAGAPLLQGLILSTDSWVHH